MLFRSRIREPYWTKYERFLKNNNFPYEYLEIHGSRWQEESRRFDLILWRPLSRPAELDEARRKIFVLQEFMGIRCYPDFRTLMLYENKLILHEVALTLGIPIVPALVSQDYDELTREYTGLQYPLVSKVTIGAGSTGVELIKHPRDARKMARQVFSRAGRATFWPYYRQKNHVYWQKFQANEGYDLRVIVIGNYILGYYRDVPRGEFRASGMRTVRKDALPEDAMRLAMEISNKLHMTFLVVDMLRDPTDKKLHVIELSPFYRAFTPEQLCVDGVPGVYIHESGRFTFAPGRYWPQELALKAFFSRW